MYYIIESIDVIENFMRNSDRKICNDTLFEALQDAVRSMKNDIPSKAVRVKVGYNGSSTDGCPVCKEEFYEEVKFCPKCGKAIDWRN